jgi:hypothetical protein
MTFVSDHPTSPAPAERTDNQRVRAIAVLVAHAECELGIENSRAPVLERLDHILGAAMSGRLHPDIYRRVWGVRRLFVTLH